MVRTVRTYAGYHKDHRFQRRLAGLCQSCPDLARAGKIRCQTCESRLKLYNNTRKALRLEQGLCAFCGENPPRDGLKSCVGCSEQKRTRPVTRKDRLKKLYGLSMEEFENLWVRQQGCCSICRREFDSHEKGTSPPSAAKAHVDHSHVTGKVRGLLCNRCNLLLGAAKDDPKLLTEAILYLEER